jgi:hypothetical protein
MKYGKECVCGRGGECQGVSAAFALLKDPRRGYVQLPQYHPTPRTYAETDMNAMRAAYLRHLRRTEESLIRQQQQQQAGSDASMRWFVALHHFHPTVVQKHSEMPGALSPIPKTLKKVDLKFLGLQNSLGDEDRVRDEEGRKRKMYYFCPNWPMDMAKADLKRMIRVSRLVSEASQPLPSKSNKSAAAATLLSPLTTSPKKERTPPKKERTTDKKAIKPAALAATAAAVVATTVVANEDKETTKEVAVTEEIAVVETLPVGWLPPAEADDAGVPAVAVAAATGAAVAGGLTVITAFSNEDEEMKEKPEDSPAPQLEAVKAGEIKMVDTRSAEIDIVKAEEPLSSRIFEQEYDEEKLPKNMTMESEEGRKFLFRRMCNFEAKRQGTSGEFVDLFIARWRASLEVMQAGIFEMARAERVIRGAALTNKAYAEAMLAMYDDVYLDSDLNTVVDPRKQKRIAKEREGLEYTVEAGATHEKSRGDAHTRSAMLGSMVDSQAVIAEKFLDNSESVLDQVVTDLANIRAYLKEQMIDFKRRGDPFIRDIQESETEIRTAFGKFFTCAYIFWLMHCL